MNPDDLKELAQLIQLLRESPEIGSIEISGRFGKRIVVTRNVVTNSSHPPAAAAAAPGHPAPAPAERERPAAASLAQPPQQLKEIKSPMVGTFYSAPEPGADSYVKVGSRVSAGQTVCIIEAMKIMNEIEAEFGGVVREILVENAQVVEFGQPLFRVDPHG
jgi:acetyl-CoA carboxylase biotin carboxyl carrier protein